MDREVGYINIHISEQSKDKAAKVGTFIINLCVEQGLTIIETIYLLEILKLSLDGTIKQVVKEEQCQNKNQD